MISELIEEFESKNWHRNPYNIGALAFHEWYSTHTKDEPMPDNMISTREAFAIWDQERDNFVAEALLRRLGYAAASNEYPDRKFEGRELCQGDGQCSFWGKCKLKS